MSKQQFKNLYLKKLKKIQLKNKYSISNYLPDKIFSFFLNYYYKGVYNHLFQNYKAKMK